MWLFIAGLGLFMLGGVSGIILMAFLQINKHYDIIEHSKEEK